MTLADADRWLDSELPMPDNGSEESYLAVREWLRSRSHAPPGSEPEEPPRPAVFAYGSVGRFSRQVAWLRDGGVCADCGRPSEGECFSTGPGWPLGDDPSAIRTLCRDCHMRRWREECRAMASESVGRDCPKQSFLEDWRRTIL